MRTPRTLTHQQQSLLQFIRMQTYNHTHTRTHTQIYEPSVGNEKQIWKDTMVAQFSIIIRFERILQRVESELRMLW